MAWFLNHYQCDRCRDTWTDGWSATCNDDCPHRGARHMSPTHSDDRTIIVDETDDGSFAVLRSPEIAEHDPAYVELALFPDREQAAAQAASLESGRSA